VRENGLKGLRKLLQEQYFDAEFLEDRQETLIEALVRSVRRGKPTEQVLALNTTCAAFAQVHIQLKGL
jgi:hypothetical protein